MELYKSVLTIFLLLLLSIAMYFDDRRPMSAKIKYKYRVKDNSIFRKILPVKDKKYFPCNYFKLIPILVLLLLTVLGLTLLLVDMLTNGFITAVVPNNVILVVTLCIWLAGVIYYVTILIWWGIVEYNEMKFTKEEKEELKRLRESRKAYDSHKRRK